MAGSTNDSDEDPDLKRAIALSLAVDNPGQERNAIELSSDDESDEDADLRRAIALSLEQTGTKIDDDSTDSGTGSSSDEDDEYHLNQKPVYRPKKQNESLTSEPGKDIPQVQSQSSQQSQTETAQASQASQAPSSALLGLAGFDRRKMEAERLARLAAKRKAPDSEQELQGRNSKLRTGPPPQVSRMTPSSTSTNMSVLHPTKKTSQLKSLKFPKGVVKKTFALGFPRTDDDIKIEEIFEKDELEMAVISSFQWDEDWMLSKIDVKRTKIYLVAFANSIDQQEEMKANTPRGATIKFCFPQISVMGSMHSKLQLLKFRNHLRIVVPTGNLVPYDWGETGVMENMVFIIDVPFIEDPERRASNVLTPFGEELAFFLKSQGLEQSLVESLGKYDFSETSRYAFVHAIGKPTGDDWKRTGYCGLGRAVSTLGLGSAENIEIDYVVASLGSVNHDLITAIYYAAQGDNGLKEYRERTARGKKAKTSSAEVALGQINEHFRIYFPSRHAVEQSRGGKESAGTICTQSKWWDSATFPRQLVHESQNVRRGLLMHSKLMLVRSKKSGKEPIAWAYVGSANLSESAWGRLTKDKQTGNPKLTCRNWECGVLVPATGSSDDSDSRATVIVKTANEQTPDSLSVFLGRIPVPIIWPSEAYGRTGAKRPWLFLEN